MQLEVWISVDLIQTIGFVAPIIKVQFSLLHIQNKIEVLTQIKPNDIDMDSQSDVATFSLSTLHSILK
jgi:hypothetical protein